MLPERYVESIRRLALGIEPIDAARRSGLPHPISIMLEGVPAPPPRRTGSQLAGWEAEDSLGVVRRRSSGRHVLTVRGGIENPLPVRLDDRRKRYVPRRLAIRLPTPISIGRVCRPALFPGAAYGPAAGAMELRGRVVRGGAAMRWARVEARETVGGRVVGRAHGDEHGEFLLILDSTATRPNLLELPLEVEVSVFGPDEAPDPAATPSSRTDPLWDLPLELVPRTSAGERILAGEELPDGYVSRPGSVRTVSFGLDGLVREEFDFS